MKGLSSTNAVVYNPANLQFGSDGSKEFLEELVERSMSDPEFRNELTSDPNEAIKKHYPDATPQDHVNINFVSNDNAHATIILPDPVEASRELSDEEIEAVAGGAAAWPTDGCSVTFKCPISTS